MENNYTTDSINRENMNSATAGGPPIPSPRIVNPPGPGPVYSTERDMAARIEQTAPLIPKNKNNPDVVSDLAVVNKSPYGDTVIPTSTRQSFRNGGSRRLRNEDPKCCLSARHTLALLGFFGFVTVYALRANLSVAIVAMVNNTAEAKAIKKSVTQCAHDANAKVTPAVTERNPNIKLGEFHWSGTTQGYILAGFFYGYLFTQIPGGWLATISAKYTLGLGVLWTAVLTLFTAPAARLSPWALLVLRVLEGLGEGVTFPAMHAIWAKWAPPLERSKLVAFTYAGAPMGNVIAYPLSGYLAQKGFAGGWPSIFYVMGLMGCVWYIFWQFFVYETPAQHPRISNAELAYLQKNIRSDKDKPPIPWIKIFTSVRFWAIAVAHFSYNWGFYTMITILPKFFKDVLNLNMESNGLYSALPFLAQWAVIGVSGAAADYMRTGCGLTTTLVRRIFNTCGLIIPACFLIGVGYVRCNVPLAIALLTIGVGFTGMAHVGFFVSHLDIAPPYAGMLMSLTNTIATIPGAVAPSVATAITKDNPDAEHWRIVFFIAAIIYITGALFYLIFVSGEEQPWARVARSRSITNAPPGSKIQDALDDEQAPITAVRRKSERPEDISAAVGTINLNDAERKGLETEMKDFYD